MKTTMVKLDDRQEAQSQAIAWLLEMERVTDPNLINSLILNILKSSKRIKDTQIVIDSKNKRMLIWLDLDFLGQWFQKRIIKTLISNMILEVLPSFELRITYNKDLLKRALKIIKGEYKNERRGTKTSTEENRTPY